MGLLTTTGTGRRGRPQGPCGPAAFAMRPPAPAAMALTVVMVVLSGCIVGRLPDPGPRSGPVWGMFAGGPARTNASPLRPSPPLRIEWEAGVGSGFGPSSPAVCDSTLFIPTLTGEVTALNLYTGEPTGSYDFGTAVFGTPLVLSGRLVVALSGDEENIVSYNLRSGSVQWSVRTGDIESSLLAAGGGIIAVGLDGSVMKIDTARGFEIWKYIPGEPSSSRSSPASDGSRVVFGTDAGVVKALDLATGDFLWGAAVGGAVFTTPALSGGRAFVASRDGSLSCFETGSGALKWRRETGSPLYGAPAVDGGRVFVGTSAGEVVALGADDGTVLWRTAVLGAVGSAPLVCGDVLYVGDLAKNLYAMNTSTGETVWQAGTPGRVRCTPVAAPGRIVVLSEDRSVLGFVEDR